MSDPAALRHRPPSRAAGGLAVAFCFILPGLAAIAAPASAIAQDEAIQLDPTTVTAKYLATVISHELSDPTYLPAPGELFGGTELSYDALGSDTYTRSGASSSHEHADTTDLVQRLSYGVIRNLAVTAEVSAGSESIRDKLAAGSLQMSKREGFAEPIVSALYRTLRQGSFPATLDLSIAYAPDLISSRVASAAAQGSFARGGDLLRLTAAVARVNAYETVQAYVRADHYGDAKRENASGYDTQTGAYWSPSLGIHTQTRFTRKIAVNLDGSYFFDETRSLFFSESRLKAVNGVGSAGEVSADLVYRVIPYRLDASVGYGHTFYGRAYTDYIGEPDADIGMNRSEDRVILRLRYRIW